MGLVTWLTTLADGGVEGRLTAYRTPGGHRRIPADALLAFLRDMGVEDDAARKMLRSLVA